MESPSQYQPYLDELIAFATGESRKDDILSAKADYFRLTGEVHEDDAFFDMRMASFLDYYLFDRREPGTELTPSEAFFALRKESDPEHAERYRAFAETIHGLFEVRKLGKGQVRLRELFSKKDFDVTERRMVAGLEKGDILEARLIPFGGQWLFSPAFCYHPRAAAKAILKEVKRRQKKEPDRPPNELTWEAAKRAVKSERYKQIAVERIYDFAQSKL